MITGTSPSKIVANSIQQVWLDNHNITMIQAPGGISGEMRRLWDHMVAKTVQEWPDGKPILMIQDLSCPEALTKHLARASQLSHSMKAGQVAYSAIVIGKGTAKRILSRVTRQSHEIGSTYHERVFESPEAAYAWLQQILLKEVLPSVAVAS